jgi:hypothetical protein
MTVTVSRALMLAMTGCKRMNGECGDIVSRAELPKLAQHLRRRLGAPFRRHRRGDSGSTTELVRED